MIKTKSSREVSQEFFEVVRAQSVCGGEISYGYMAGFLEGFIAGLADVPKVKAEMETRIHHYLMEMNRKDSRLVSK